MGVYNSTVTPDMYIQQHSLTGKNHKQMTIEWFKQSNIDNVVATKIGMPFIPFNA